MKETVAYRLKNARILNGMSLQEVADELGVSKQMINKYEKAESIPPSDKLLKLSRLFNVKIDYFFRRFKVDLGVINFRKKTAFSQKKQDALKEKIKIELENYLWIEDLLGIDSSFKNPIRKIEIKDNRFITDAVVELKKEWQIGFDPMHNLIQLFEDKEIKVIELKNVDPKFDGLATYVNNKYPVIVINGDFNVERKRFTLSHELGHLLLNLNDCELKTEESFCNKFASEFLFPKQNIFSEFSDNRAKISLTELINIQEKYGISIRAIVYKLSEIGVMSENRAKNFYKHINYDSSLREKVDQPRFSSIEKSDRFENLVLRALNEELITISKASALLNVSIEKLKENLSF